MEYDLDIALEFVEKVNPEPTPIENITAQTGDLLFPIIFVVLALLLVSFGAFMFFKKRKARVSEATTQAGTALKASALMTSKWIVLAVVATLVTAVALFTGSIMQAQASGEGKIETPSTVKAYVDKEAGTVSFDKSWIKNISSGEIIFDKSRVEQVDESLEICDLSESNFNINALGGTVFNGHPNDKTPYIPTDLTALSPEETSDMTFDLTNVSGTDLYNLIGHKVFNIKLWYLDSAIPVPQPNKLTYNGAVQTGVKEGIGYTLSGTTETKDAGTYMATARLISGFVWEDGSHDDKTITWKIDKLAMNITSADAEKTYDGTKLSKEEVTEDPAFPDGEGFVYTWTSNIVNVENTADANNTFTYEAKAGTNLNNYDVTPAYGKLTINPRDITLKSGTQSWTYDATSHSCEEATVTAGSWVGTEGVTYENFAKVIDHSDTPTDNTFEYEANEGTLLSNYTITEEYGKISIDKITTPIEVTANSKEKMYDGKDLKDNGFTYTQDILQGTDTLYATITGEIKNVGEADNTVGEVKIMRGANDATANYTFGEHKKGKLKITKRPITFTSATETFDYNGQAHYNQNITVGGEGWVGTEYATYTDFATITDYVEGGVENSFTYNEGPGTSFDNYQISVICGTLNINKISTAIVVTAASDTKEYDGSALTNSNYTFTQGVLINGDRLEATIKGQAKDVDTPGTNAVTNVKVWRGTEDATSNYIFGTHISGTLTITPKDVTVKSEDHDWTYNGEAHSWNVIKVTSGGFVKDEGITPNNFATIKDYTEDGVSNTYEYTAQTGTKLSNYNLKTEAGTLKINKREISISSVGASFEYNATEQSNPEVKVLSGEWVGDEGLDYKNFATAIDYNGEGIDNTFQYTAKAGTNLSNYSLDVKYEKLQITKVVSPITVTAADANKVYDGDALTSGEYTYTQNILKGSDALIATTGGSVTNVGTATNTITDIVVKRGEVVATQNYNFQRVEGTLEVTQRNIVLLSASGEWTYDGQSHNAPSAAPTEGTSWAKSEGVEYSGFPSVTNYNGEGVDNIFEYTAKSGTNLNNYNVTKKYGKLIVKQVSTAIVVTANSKTREYDGTTLTDAGYTYTQDVLVSGDELTATIEAESTVKNAGDTAANKVTSVKVMRGSQDVTDNYTFGTHVNGTLEVTKRNVVLQSEGFTWTYNSMTHGNQVAKVKDGYSFAPGEGVSYSNFATVIDYTEQPVPNTFDYAANVGTNLSNYEITFEYGNLVINKITTPLIVTAASKYKTYDGEALTDNTFTYTDNILQDNDVLTATVEGTITNYGNTGNKVTSVKIMRGEDDATNNYTFGDSVDGTLSIYKRNITITSKSMSWTFDGSPHSYAEVEVSGEWVGEQGVELSGFPSVKTVDEGEVENRFICSAKEGTDLKNYNLISNYGKIKIVQVGSPIIVTANSNSKVYDGQPLEDDGFTYTPQGILPEGYTIEATVTGSKTDVGRENNVVDKDSIKIFDKDHKDVTTSYTIGYPVNGHLEVTKREVTIKSENKDWTYDGTEHSWDEINVTSGSFVEGEGVESYDHTKIIDHQNEPINNEFSYKAKEGTNLDNYRITREYGTLQINIITTPIVVTPATKSKVYDGTALTDNSYTFTPNVLVDGDELDVVIVDSITDVGETTNSVESYKVMRGDKNATINYNLAIPETGTLTVTQRPITLTSGSESWDYDGEIHTKNSVAVSGDGWADGEGATYSNFPTVKDVKDGEKDNIFDIIPTENTKLTNYNINIVKGKISIKKVSDPLIVTANSKSKTYDGTALTDAGFTHTNVLKGSDQVVATISGSQTNAGESANVVVEDSVKVQRDGVDISDNYSFGTHVNGTLVVNKRAIILTSSDYEGTYDGQEHSATTVTVGGDGLASGQVAAYSNFAKIKNYTEGGVENTFTFALEGGISTENYAVTYNYGTLIVNKKAVTLTSGDGSREYNGLPLTVESVTPAGFVDGEGVAEYKDFTSVIDVCENVNNEFSYVLKEGTLASNYTITSAYGKLTITSYTGEIKVTAKSDSKKYDGTALTKNDYTLEGSTVGSDELIVTIEGSIKDAGTSENKITSLKIMRGTVDATGNYSNVITENGTLTINPRLVTLTSGSYNEEYDGAEHTINSLTIGGEDGFIGQEGLESYSDFPTVIDVCTNTPNTFTYQLKENTKPQNYTITKVEGKLTITKVSTAIVVTANSDSKDYDGDPLTNSGYTKTGSTKGTDQLVVVIEGTITNAGTVTNTVTSVKVTRQVGDTTKDVSSNYNLGPHVNGTLTVNKVKPSVTWSGVSTNEYKLERNNVYTDPYNFAFASYDIELSSTNTDSGTVIDVTDTGTNPGVTVNATKITIDPTATSSTTFDLTLKAQTAETANYLASDAAEANIKIAISSLWYKLSNDTIYLSAFRTNETPTEIPSVLQSEDIPWQNSTIKRVAKYFVILGNSNEPKIKPSSMKGWFFGCAATLSYTGLENIDTSQVADFTKLFGNNIKLTSLDLSSFIIDNTDTTTNMLTSTKVGYKEISIGEKWHKNLAECGLRGEAWLNSAGKFYLNADIPVECDATYTLANKQLDVTAPDSSVADFKLDDGSTFPSVIYFNDEFPLHVTTHQEESKAFDESTGNYVVTFIDTVNVEVKHDGVTTYSYFGKLGIKQNDYKFVEWKIQNTSPTEEFDYEKVYDITTSDALNVDVSAAYNATAVQYTNGQMVFYADGKDHSIDANFLAQYSAENSKVNSSTLSTADKASVLPKWIAPSLYPYNNMTSIIFDASFKNFEGYNYISAPGDQGYTTTATSFDNMSGWFMNFADVVSISGLENIPSSIVDMRYMFSGLKTTSNFDIFDLSSVDMSNVIFTESMFENVGGGLASVILPDNVSSSVYPKTLKIYDAKDLEYKKMFANALNLKNVTFGENFGSIEIPANYESMFKNCIRMQDADLRNCLNIGSKDCDTTGMLDGTIGLKTFIVGFGKLDPDIPVEAKTMADLGISTEILWRTDTGEKYQPGEIPLINTRYSNAKMINLHFGNNSATPLAGWYNSESNPQLDLEVCIETIVHFDTSQQKFTVCSNLYGGGEPLYEVRLGINYPFLFDYITDADHILDRPLSDDTNIIVNYAEGGRIGKTAKLLDLQEADQPHKAIFLYDDLTLEQYSAKYGSALKNIWYVKNCFNTDTNPYPEWRDAMSGTGGVIVVFDESFKDFHSYYDAKDQLVAFEGMCGFFRSWTIGDIIGGENVPSGITDISNLFYASYVDMPDKCLDMSNWNLDSVWFAKHAFSNIKRASNTTKIIIPDNFASTNTGKYPGEAELNLMFTDPNDGTLLWAEEIEIGNNFGANTSNFMNLFAVLERLTSVKIGDNFCPRKNSDKVIDLSYMFAQSPYLLRVDLSGLAADKHYNISGLCIGENRLTTLNLPKNHVYIEAAEQAFYGCELLTALDFTNCEFSQTGKYSEMLTFCVTLSNIVVGDSWIGNASFADVGYNPQYWGLPDFNWYKGDEPWSVYDPTVTNSSYINHSTVKVTISIPDEFKNMASLTMSVSQNGVQEISFNVVSFAGSTWWNRSSKEIAVSDIRGDSISFYLHCSDDIFKSNNWISNYPEREAIDGSQGDCYITPELNEYQTTSKAVYNKVTKDLTLYYDNNPHNETSNNVVWEIKDEPFIPAKEYNEFSSITIDPSFKDAKYFDDELEQQVPITSAEQWFSEISFESISGFENMPNTITDVPGMFYNSVPKDEKFIFDFRKWDMSNVHNAEAMLANIMPLEKNDYCNWSVYLPDNFASNDTSTDGTWMPQMFARSEFSNIYFGSNFAPNGNTYREMFAQCKQIENLDLSSFTSTTSTFDLNNMFAGCAYLKTVKLWGTPTTPGVLSQLFTECYSLTDVDMSNINISSSVASQNIFESCKVLTKLKFGGLPTDSTKLYELGYSPDYSDRGGNWTKNGEEIVEHRFSQEVLESGVTYENSNYANVRFSATENVILTSGDTKKTNFEFKVPKQSMVEYHNQDFAVWYEGTTYFTVTAPIVEGSSFSWKTDDAISGDKIIDNTFVSASYLTNKRAKAILYGNRDGKYGPYVQDMVFVYDDKRYEPQDEYIIAVYDVYNTSMSQHIYPQWINDPWSEPEYVPKRVVIDESFKYFKMYDDKETGETVFNSIDCWFANMWNTEFVGLENLPANQIKSAAWTFKGTGPNEYASYSQYNPYITTLDLRNFNQSKIENMESMFMQSSYTNILLSESFGNAARNCENLFAGCTNLLSLDLRSFNTENIDPYYAMCRGLESLSTFIVGNNWHFTMEEACLDEPESGFTWVDSFGNNYTFTNLPDANVLYKLVSVEMAANSNDSGEFSNNLADDSADANLQNDNGAAENGINDAANNDNGLAGAGGAAAIMGAPLAFGLAFRKRIRGRHVSCFKN